MTKKVPVVRITTPDAAAAAFADAEVGASRADAASGRIGRFVDAVRSLRPGVTPADIGHRTRRVRRIPGARFDGVVDVVGAALIGAWWTRSLDRVVGVVSDRRQVLPMPIHSTLDRSAAPA